MSGFVKKSISETATSTGRSGALTRGFFNQMGIAGIKNEKIISQSMEAISGKAYPLTHTRIPY